MTGLARGRLVRLVVAVALVALAAIGLRLSQGAADRDFEVARGVVGQPVAVEGGTVTADRVRVGTALVRYRKVEARTEGLFVAVRVEIAATGPRQVRTYTPRLLSGERRYAGVGLSSTTGAAEPGFATTGDLVFEVDPARIDDLTLELDPFELVSGYTEQVRIHLGITPDNAERWRAAARDQTVEPALPESRGL